MLVVEHDDEAIMTADYVLDIGPGAGVHGGKVVAAGTPAECARQPGLAHRRLPQRPQGHRHSGRTARTRDPKRADPHPRRHAPTTCAMCPRTFRSGLFTCVTGVSGSGKSTLVNDTLFAGAARHLGLTGFDAPQVASIEGLEFIDRVIDIDQSPIGRTPRSNPATYTGLFAPLRELFAQVPEARARGYDAGRFSFNVKGGRCEACQGDGVIRVEMHFLPDVYVACDVCHGRRYNRETLEIRYRGKNIHDVLQMTIEDALAFFQPVPMIASQAADAAGRGPVLHPARAERDDAVRRRGAARETGA